MQAQDIPKGILVITHGKEDNNYKPVWAVSEPELKVIAKDTNGKPVRYEFSMKLSCSVQRHSSTPYYDVCEVSVDVCYKPVSP